MKDISGPELQIQLKELDIHLPIIFISAHPDITLAVRVMKAGAVDFHSKPFNHHNLLESINTALNIDKVNREKILKNSTTEAKFVLLSPREIQILRGIVAGKQNKILSNDLNISLKTVEAHRANIMKKMRVRT